MRTGLIRFLAVLTFVVVTTAVSRSENKVTLNVDLDELRGAELLNFMRAAVPEVYGGESQPPLDLPTLARLHAHFVSHTQDLKHPEKLWARDTQRRLEGLMREALEKVDLPTLRQMTLGDGKRNFGNAHLYPALYQRLIAAEVAKVCAQPKFRPTFPSDAPLVPEHLRWSPSAPGTDTAALQRAVGPFTKLLADLSKQKPRGIHKDRVVFSDMMSAVLREREEKVATKLLSFTRGESRCATGADEFEYTRMTLVFIGLLRERRIAEALGLSLYVPDAPAWLRMPGRPIDQWRIDLLKFCGFDWEEVLLAAGRVEVLAAAGSEKAAQHGLAILKSAPPDHNGWPWDLRKLASFLAPGDPQYWSKDDPRTAISPQTQAGIIALLDGALRDDLAFHKLDPVLAVFEELRRLETKDALRRMLKHPSTTFANRAASVLNGLDEQIEPIPPSPPVRFRVYLNDQPWRSAELAYSILDSKVRGFGGGYLKTDAEGFATIPRDEFLDPAKRGTRMAVKYWPSNGNSVGKDGLFPNPWVEMEIAAPVAFDEVIKVSFSACALPIHIAYGAPPPRMAKAPIRLKLRKSGMTEPADTSVTLCFDQEHTNAPTNIVLSAITPGEYEFLAEVPGSLHYVSAPFEVKPGMPPVQVKLEKGSNVYAALFVPENARGAHEIRLFHGEDDVTDKYRTQDFENSARPLFAGVPKGRYQLRVLSTAEFMRRHYLSEWKAPESRWQSDFRDGVDCAGVVVDFTIDDTTPPLLDLGRIENPPVEAMRAKAGPAKAITAGAPQE